MILKKPKIFNDRRVLQNFSIDGLEVKPPDCSWHNSPFKYSHADIITGELSIIYNENLHKVLAKGPKYVESQSMN